MLELGYRLAPGAQLYFATGGPNENQMASNHPGSRRRGVQIIVDDVGLLEDPFQEGGPAAMAVQTVSTRVCSIFHPAGTTANEDSGKSGTWEGDFVDGGDVGRRSPRRTSPGTAPSQAGCTTSAAGRITTWCRQ